MQTTRGLRVLALALALPAASLALGHGSVAHASTAVQVAFPGVLVIVAQPGGTNNLSVVREADQTVVRDTGEVLAPGAGCTAIDQHAVRCFGVTEGVEVSAADLNDRVFVNVPSPSVVLRGDDGNDTLEVGPLTIGTPQLVGGRGTDNLIGGPAADVLIGGEGNDTHRGGAGNDVMDGGPGPDGFVGGSGKDEVTYISRTAAVTADIDGVVNDDGEVGERDTISTDVERLVGGAGNDKLTGSPNDDVLDGFTGDDQLFGLGGNDQVLGHQGANRLDGGAGEDELRSDGGLDQQFGGPGNDELIVENAIAVMDGGPGPAGADTDSDSYTVLGSPLGISFAQVDYSARQTPVTVTLDGFANDGMTGSNENDFVPTFVHGVVGGSAGDRLTARRSLIQHSLFGGPGNDVVITLDNGALDQVNPGSGHDECAVDLSDSHTGCDKILVGGV